MRFLVSFSLCIFGVASSSAASGISDAAATWACWIREPIALSKCESNQGMFPARLHIARPCTEEEKSFWQLFPVGHEGIVSIEEITTVERLCTTKKFVIVRVNEKQFLIVKLDRPFEPWLSFSTLKDVNEYLWNEGEPLVAHREFLSPSEFLQSTRPKPTFGEQVGTVLLLSLFLVGIVGWSVCWIRKQWRDSQPQRQEMLRLLKQW